MKAIEIDHTYIKAWNNIYFLLKIKDVVKKYNNSDIFLNIKNKLFNLDPLNYSLLDYRLNEDGKKSVLFFNKVLKAISKKCLV